MKKIIKEAVLIAMAVFLLSACRQYTKDTPKYSIEETSAKEIDLTKQAIPGMNSFLSIGKLAYQKNFSIVNTCFLDDYSVLILYVNSDASQLKVAVLSLYDGELTVMSSVATGMQNENTAFCFIGTSPVVIRDTVGGTVLVIGEDGQLVDGLIDGTRYEKLVCGTNIAYGLCSDNGNIESINLITGDAQIIYEAAAHKSAAITDLKELAENSNILVVAGCDKTKLTDATYFLDINSGELTREVMSTLEVYAGSKYIYSVDNGDTNLKIYKRNLDNLSSVCLMDYTKEAFVDYFNIQDDNIILEEYGDKGIEFRWGSLEEEKLTASSVLDMEVCNSFYGIDENMGYILYPSFGHYNNYSSDMNMLVFTMSNGYDVNDIILWDIDTANQDNIAIASDTYIDTIDYSVSQLIDYGELTQRINNIYDKYGIMIYIGDNAAKKYAGYNVELITDYSIMEQGLADFEKVLAKYPDNFFTYLVSDNYLNGISVYFTGSITPAEEDSISSAAAFATKSHDYEILVFDMNQNYSMENNAAHEISHAIFDRIIYDQINTGEIYFDDEEWNKLNPPGFEYALSYFTPEGEEYSIYGDESNTSQQYYNDWILDNVYFVDCYSKTFETEDLARLMENAMNMDFAGEYMQSLHIKAKMQYYFDAIRKSWDTTGWPAVTSWEEAVR